MSDLELGAISAQRDHALWASLGPREVGRIVGLRMWNSGWSLLLLFDLGSHYLGLRSGAQMMRTPLAILPQALLVAATALGVWLARRRCEVLVLATIPAYFLVVHALTYPSERYMLPSMLILCVLAAVGVGELVQSE